MTIVKICAILMVLALLITAGGYVLGAGKEK